MLNFEMRKSVVVNGRDHILVDEKTSEKMSAVGLGQREFYTPLNVFSFVEILATDEQAMERLKALLPEGDTKPIIFELTDSIGSVLNYKSAHKGQLFGGHSWAGCLADYENAWVAFCTNSYR